MCFDSILIRLNKKIFSDMKYMTKAADGRNRRLFVWHGRRIMCCFLCRERMVI